MKRLSFYISILLFINNICTFAQGNELDAYVMTGTDLNGSARYMSMAGAFGALGGDLSVMSHNPAGLGIYRSSEIAGTLNISSVNTSANWTGVKNDMNKTNFDINNIGFEFYFPTSSDGIRNVNIGFMYNKLKNYGRKYNMECNGQNYSMADYTAILANGISPTELDREFRDIRPGDWLAALGYGAGFFSNFNGGNKYQTAFGRTAGASASPNQSYLHVYESGSIDEYDFSFGMNVSNKVFLGASLAITDICRRYTSKYRDDFKSPEQTDDFLYLENQLSTEGAAVSASIGAILNLDMVRLGIAYNSPKWYDLTDYYWGYAESDIVGYDPSFKSDNTPNDGISEYKFTSPGRWIFSGALIFGQSALLSVDYELSNYSQMNFADADGYKYDEINGWIKNGFKNMHTLRVGAEFKIYPQFAIRAGYMMQTSPMKSALYNNEYEIYPSGTIPHIEISGKATNYFTVGLGYRFTPNFYMDLAGVYRYKKSEVQPFSTISTGEELETVFGNLDTKTTTVALTLGYKF